MFAICDGVAHLGNLGGVVHARLEVGDAGGDLGEGQLAAAAVHAHQQLLGGGGGCG
jgi:hypothetical protein